MKKGGRAARAPFKNRLDKQGFPRPFSKKNPSPLRALLPAAGVFSRKYGIFVDPKNSSQLRYFPARFARRRQTLQGVWK